MDSFSFEADDRPSRRRTRPPKKRDFVGEAYDWVRMNVEFQDTMFLGPISTEKHDIRHFPKWIADRVVAMLVRDGVLAGPVFIPKEKDGEPLWYSVRDGGRDWHVAWINGAWRESFS